MNFGSSYSYRITKYHTYLDAAQQILSSPPDEWTGFCDIAQGLVSFADYQVVETQYVEVIMEICQYLELTELTFLDCSYITPVSASIYPDLEGRQVPIDERLIAIIRSILREEFWARLWHPHCEFHFGYDYYLYCVAGQDLSQFFALIASPLNIEPFRFFVDR